MNALASVRSLATRPPLQAGGAHVTFRVKGETPIRKLIVKFEEAKGFSRGVYKYMADGKIITAADEKADDAAKTVTVSELGLEDGDKVDVMLAQDGGGCA